MTFIEIQDKLQKSFNYSQYSIVRDITLCVVVYITYVYLPFDTFTQIWKIYFGLIFLRFILSELTTLRDSSNSNKKYFQMSGHMTLFTLSILFAAKQNLFNLQNVIFRNTLLFVYGIMNVIVHAHYTTDIINTTVFVHFIYTFF
jgi:hypothetical protein